MTRIPTRSRRQAMDWSLVLVSQGIESTIDREPETGRWGLLVHPRDSEKAFKTLRQYHLENHGWPWPEQFPWKGPHFDWTSLIWAGVLLSVHLLVTARPYIGQRGIMDSSAVLDGQWWRIFTAMMLHADSAHLAANLSLGVVLLGLAMARYGRGTALLATWLAGAIANVASLAINVKPFDGLGASGMVMAALGLLSVQTLQRRQWNRPSLKYTLGGLVAGTMLFVLYGLAPDSDVVSHAGGFIGGLAFGVVLIFVPARLVANRKFNRSCVIALAVLVLVTWGFALGT